MEGHSRVTSPSTGVERKTKQKRALANLLEESDAFRSAQELFLELRQRGERVGLTTVYNQLRVLADAGAVDVLRADDGEIRYRRCGLDQHHHHLVCRHCNATIEIEGAEVERWANHIAAQYGYTEIAHTVEITGTCAKCRS